MDDTNSIVSADGLRVLARRDAMVDQAKIDQIHQIQAAMKKQTSDGGKSRHSIFTAPPPSGALTAEEKQRIADDVTQRVLADRHKKAEYSTFYQEELREAQERTDAAFGANVPPSPREPVYRPGDETQNARMAQLTNLARQQVTLEEQQIIESITAVIGMTAQIVESGAQALDFHMIETQDLSVEVRRAIDNEEFSIALRHMLQQGGGELFKNPYISIGTLIMSLVMKNHGRITNAKACGRSPARLKHDAEKLRLDKEAQLEKRRQRAAERQRRRDAEAERDAAPSIEQKLNARIDEVNKQMRQDMTSLITSVNTLIEQRSARSGRSSRKSSPRGDRSRNGRRRHRSGSASSSSSEASGSEASEASEASKASVPRGTSKKSTHSGTSPRPMASATASATLAPIDEVTDTADDIALSEAPTVEDRSDDDAGSEASASSSDAPPADELIVAPVAAPSLGDGAFAKIIGGVAPIVQQLNESGRKEEAIQAKADDLKDSIRRLNFKF